MHVLILKPGGSLLLQVELVAVLPPASVEKVQSPALVLDFPVGKPRYNQTSTWRETCLQQRSKCNSSQPTVSCLLSFFLLLLKSVSLASVLIPCLCPQS